jgi:hypothetical protein
MSRAYQMHAPIKLNVIPGSDGMGRVERVTDEKRYPAGKGFVATVVTCDYCESRKVEMGDNGLLQDGDGYADGWKIIAALEPFTFGQLQMRNHRHTLDACPACVRAEGFEND